MNQIEFYFVTTMFFLVVIIAMILFRPKNRNKEKEEIKKLNYELVKHIQESSEEYILKLKQEKEEYVARMEKEKKKIEEDLKRVTSILEIILEHKKENETKTKVVKKQTVPSVPKTTEEHISELYQKGHTVEEISSEVKEYKGVVELILNMEKNKSVI